MQNIMILVLALKYHEIHTLAMCMNDLLGEFFEGCVESEQETARLRFNFVWRLLGNEERQVVLDACPFERFANEHAEKNGLEKPYAEDSVSKYGVVKWKRVRPDPTDLGALKDVPELIYGLWKKARK